MVDRKRIFKLMTGMIVAGSEPELEDYVKNEYQEGSEYMKWQEEVYEARLRLGERLHGDEEDSDILAIVENYESIIEKRCISSIENNSSPGLDMDSGSATDGTYQSYEEYEAINNATSSLLARLQTDQHDLDILSMLNGYEAMLTYLMGKMDCYVKYYMQTKDIRPDSRP